MAPRRSAGERRANGEAGEVLARLSPGDHLCIIYATEEEHRHILSQFVRHGLERGEKVLYIVDAHTARQLRQHLRGVDAKEAERRGQLAFMTQAETYTSEGAFDPQRMISLLSRETDRAQAEGYPALRVTGEMSWALRGLPGSERLIEYEAMLNEYLPGSACIGLCQYDRRKFSPEVLLDVLRTHPIAVIGTQVYDNFYYVPPGELLGENSAAAELDRWLDGLASRKQANDALRAQRDFSETLIQGSPVFFVAINPDGTTRLVNQAMIEALGYEQDEVLGQDYMETFVPKQDRPALREVLGELTQTAQGTKNVNRVRAKDGRELLVEWHGRPVLNADGKLAYFFGAGLDITERRHAEETLRRTQFTVDKSPSSIFWISPGGQFTYVNETAAEKLGYSREELLSMHVWDVDPNYPPERRTEQWNLYREVGEFTFETEHRRRDGTTFPVRINSYHLAFEGQEMEVAEAEDVSEQKQAEKELRESEERYRSLFQESPVAMFEEDYSGVREEMDSLRQAGVSDLEAYLDEHPEVLEDWISRVRFLDANKAAMDLFGVGSTDALIAFARRERMGPAAEAMRHEFVELFRGHTQVQHKGRARDVNGDYLETVVLLVVLGGHEQTLDRVLVSIQDVSDQVHSREETERTLARMERVFEGTVGALASVSEIRDPYTAGHQRGLAQLACAIARQLGLEEERVQGIRVGALLHDIGKVFVPTEILNRPGKLGDLEYSMIQAHPQVGHDILKDIEFPWPVAEMVLQHHERLDGSGYPQGLTGEQIILEARILAVADVVDAMASHRPYRPAHGKEAALAEIRQGAGRLYDPRVVEACEELFINGFALDEESDQQGL